jgi:hypothetical protein
MSQYQELVEQNSLAFLFKWQVSVFMPEILTSLT